MLKSFSSSKFLLSIIIVFLVAFPKGGIKSNEIPITFGYILLGLCAVGFSLKNFALKSYEGLNKKVLVAYASTIPLSVISIMVMIFNGVESFGYSIGFQTGFTVLPAIFLFILYPQIQVIDRIFFLKYLRLCITFVAVFGIVAFTYKLKTGDFIQIPFLTLNASDVDQLDQKHIDRGDGIFKLISTYNNGNIYGVCMLMMLPLYDFAQQSKIAKIIVRISLILTLSRTVWLGLIAYEGLRMVYLKPFRLNQLIQFFAVVCLVSSAIFWAISFIGFDSTFIFDTNLGGRAPVVNAVKWDLLQEEPVQFLSEIIIVNFVIAFGVLPLVFYIISTFTPIVLAVTSKNRNEPHLRACVAGMVMLQICGLADGPILLIPVMAFYWALAALALTVTSKQDTAI